MEAARIGLVLGAGAYPGWPFHLAVLREVERYLDVDLREVPVAVGTSVGSMVAVLLRAGFSLADLLAHARGEAMSDDGAHLLHEVLDPPGALPPDFPSWRLPTVRPTAAPLGWWAVAGQGGMRNWVPGLASMLLPRGRTDHSVFGRAADSLLPGGWPERDTWVVAMRARDGARIVFGRDAATSPGLAITASSAIPGYFAPVEIAGESYVDAGVLSTTNADLLVGRADVDLVVVVAPLGTEDGPTATVDTPLRLLVASQVRDEVRRLRAVGHPVAVLQPPRAVARAMQGDPIRMSPERVHRVLEETTRWAGETVWRRLHEAVRHR